MCTTSDKDRAINIVELVKYPERVYPIGRLDKDSEGLILLTNQGDLVNKMMRAGNAHEKEYIVTIDKPVTAAFLEKMQEGVWLEELDVMTRPCVAEATGRREFRIILTQGLNRQIRRMCEAFGFKVVRLKRVRVMNVLLGDLAPGKWRKLSEEEYQSLKRECAAGDSEWADLPGTGRGGCAGTRRGSGDGGVARRNAAGREQTEAETRIVLYPAIC